MIPRPAASRVVHTRGEPLTPTRMPRRLSRPAEAGQGDGPQTLSPLAALLLVAAGAFAIELALMYVLHRLEVSPILEAVIDATGLVVLILPVLYYALLRPLQAQVAERQVAERALRESLDWNRGILDAAFEGILITDERAIIEQANPAAARIFGYGREELVGQSLNMLIPEPERSLHDRHVRNYVHDGKARIIGKDREIRGLRKDGTVFPIEIAITELWSGGRRHFVGVLRDITARKQAEAALHKAREELEQRVEERTAELTQINAALQHEVEERKRIQHELERLATTDALTGIRNRRAFDELLQMELVRARRYGGTLALILLDIDHFKRINDRHGHQAGDHVLVELARLVAARLRASEIFARWGGEEFIILAPNTDAEDATHLAEEIRARIEAHPFPGVGRVTASFGVTQYAPHDTADSLWKRADTALYRAKDAGRNKVEVELAA